jgi:multidrug transporter EmrE-like cation transporter
MGLLHGTLLLYSGLSILAKYAGIHLAAQRHDLALLFLGLEFLALLVYTLLWQQVLRRMPLSFAYSNKAVCTLWTCLLGLLFFGESLTWGKALGLLVVLAGVWFVVTDHDV